jgi:hypothetical protein
MLITAVDVGAGIFNFTVNIIILIAERTARQFAATGHPEGAKRLKNPLAGMRPFPELVLSNAEGLGMTPWLQQKLSCSMIVERG